MRDVIRILTIFGMILWFGFPHYAYSEDAKEKTGVYTMGEVVVSGKQMGVESIGTVREITAADIERQGARTLKEALLLAPGISIRTATDGIARVDMRGFRTRHVLLLLNGIPFNTAFDGQFDPSLIPSENIAKIKISYGNHSVLYGQGGLGGVINIITKKGKKGLHGSTKYERGQFKRNLANASVSGGSDGFDAFVSGSVLDSKGFLLSEDFDTNTEENGGKRDNSDKEHNNLFANFGYAPSDVFQMGIVANVMEGEFGKPPIAIPSGADPIFASNPKYVRVENYKGYSGQVSMNYDMPGPLGFRSWVFANRLDEDENQYDDDGYDSTDARRTYDATNVTTIYGGTFQTSADLSDFGLITASFSAEEQLYDTSGRIRDVTPGWLTRHFSEDYNLRVYSAAMEYEVAPIDRLGLVFGYSHHWFDKESGEKDNDFGLLAGAHYDLFEHTRIRGSAARKIRFPSIRQLYEEGSGNEDLDPERSCNYELGIRQGLFGHTVLELTGFYIDVKDYIEKVDSTDRFENNEKYLFRGFEFTAENRFFKNLLLRAGYTYLDTIDRSPGSDKDDLQYRPKHKLTVEGEYAFDFGLTAYAGVLRVADQHYYSRNMPLQKAKLNDYTILNVKLTQAIWKDMASVYIGVDNLTDLDYEESYGFPRPGRTVYGGIEISF